MVFFINSKYYEIATLCRPKCVCFEYHTLPQDIQQLTYNDFGTHHADSNMHHVKIKLHGIQETYNLDFLCIFKLLLGMEYF